MAMRTSFSLTNSTTSNDGGRIASDGAGLVAPAAGWGEFCALAGEGEVFVCSAAGAAIAGVFAVVAIISGFEAPPRGIPRAAKTLSTIRAIVSRSGTIEGVVSVPDAATAATTADAAEIVDVASAVAAMVLPDSAGEAENDAPAIR